MKHVLLAFTLLFTLSMANAQNSPQAIEAAKRHRAEKSSTGASPATARQNSTPLASPVPSTASAAQQLETCKTNAKWNLYKRERCVWQCVQKPVGQRRLPSTKLG